MSSLTDEQKRKIEESRKKALAIRATKSQGTNAEIKNKTSPFSAISGAIFKKRPNVPSWLGEKNANYVTQTRPSVQLQLSPCGKLSSNLPAKKGQPSRVNPFKKQQNFSSLTNSSAKYQKGHDQKQPVSKDISSTTSAKAPAIKGKCVLMSRDHFVIEISYSAPLVTLFKTMETKQYDIMTKKWSFELREYQRLMTAVSSLSDAVFIEPLPRCVLNTFSKAIHGHPQAHHIAQADLSKVDPELVNHLFHFQKEGVNFAISHKGRVLLADDMGLGKTIQALCVAAYYRDEWPLLVVVPSSVRFAWREQILRWLPSVDAEKISVVVTGKESASSGDVVIISYDLMVRKQKELLERSFQVIIMDESHSLKNNKTARTKTAFPLLKRAKRVLLLSGTPALSRPSELFTQLSAVDNSLFPRFHEFGLRYCDGKQLPWGWDFSGSSNLTELQLVLEERIMIRRLKRDVLDQLPSKIRQMVVLDPSCVKIDKTMKVSHTFVAKAKGSDRRSALLQYFHETGTAKKQAVREYIMDQLEAGNKLLVFGHHQEVLDAIEESVAKTYRYIRIDGRTGTEQRSVLCDQFQETDDVRIAILSICAANAGLNLMAASLVIFAELFWNPGILIQAEDRAHRIGQLDSVNIHYLVAKGTADDFIWPLVQAKLAVLSKAGLSKEDFTQAETTHFKDPKQKDILSYFEESFFDDEMVFDDNIEMKDKKETVTAPTLFSYFKPDAAVSDGGPGTSNQAVPLCTDESLEQELASDWLDDECFQESDETINDPDYPPAKKSKIH